MLWSPVSRPAGREKDPEYWRGQAQETLRAALRLQRLNQNVAKNLILFLGDGEMGHPPGVRGGGGRRAGGCDEVGAGIKWDCNKLGAAMEWVLR